MTIGIALTKQQLDADTGSLALEMVRFLARLQQMREFFQITPDATLEGLAPGYSAAEVATLKSAFVSDAGTIINVLTGAAALPAAQDLRANIFQCCGDCQG